jgi:hypothetical protein
MPDGDVNDLGHVRNVVRAVQEAVEIAWRDWDTNRTIKSIELNLKTLIETGGGVTVSIKLPKFNDSASDAEQPTLGGGIDITSVATHEVNLTLTPMRVNRIAPLPIRDSIKEAVEVIKQVLDELKLTAEYNLGEAVITLDFVVTVTGNIKIVDFNFNRKEQLTNKLIIRVV